MTAATSPAPHQLARRALTAVIVVWCIVAAVAVGATISCVGWDSESAWVDGREGLFLSISSLVIAVVALGPNLLGPQTLPSAQSAAPERSPDSGPLEQLGNRFLIGMGIRLPGTVALFLFSSYYFENSATITAAWVLLWHAILLAAEVATLYRLVLKTAPIPSND